MTIRIKKDEYTENIPGLLGTFEYIEMSFEELEIRKDRFNPKTIVEIWDKDKKIDELKLEDIFNLK